jgi:hypothetical protein
MEMPIDPIDQTTLGEMEEQRVAALSDAQIDEADVLASAQDDLTLWDGYFSENITRGKDDMNFVLRDQWTAIERSEFTRLFKPAMTFNKLYDTVKKIVGEQRKNKPDLLVRSLTGKATQEQINLRADLVRTISYQSQNDLVYQIAFKQALLMGYGGYDIVLDYESPTSFNPVIRYELIPDITRTSYDPTAIKPHKGDGNFCARQFVYTKQEFFAEYPHVSNPVSYSDPRSLLDFQWETRDTIVVCKYTRKEWFNVKMLKLSNGMVVTEEEWEDMQKQFEMVKNLAKEDVIVRNIILNEIPKIVADRRTKDYKIRQYKLTQNQVLEFTDWPSKYLNMIFVDGDSYFVNGQQYTRSFVHEARDAQRFINYVGSEIAAEIKNRRREQWLGTPDNIIGYEQLWRNPELQNGILIAKPDPKTGQMPIKMPPWELSNSLLQHFQRGNQDIREILGFSEQEELQGRDMSGKARRERKMEGSMSAYVYFDNLNQAIEQGGRVVLDLLPIIAGEDERHMVVSKADGRTESVILNQRTKDGIINALDQGDYDIEIDTGPSFAVQKDTALEFFQQTIAANPQTFPLIADLWAKNLDVQFMPQISERFKSMVPPEILAKEEGKPAPPSQPNPQAMMAMMEMKSQQEKMQNDRVQLELKKEELRLKQEQHELDKAEAIIKARQMDMENQLDVYNHQANIEEAKIRHGLDHKKADYDFTSKIANMLTDIHKHENPQKKENKNI